MNDFSIGNVDNLSVVEKIANRSEQISLDDIRLCDEAKGKT